MVAVGVPALVVPGPGADGDDPDARPRSAGGPAGGTGPGGAGRRTGGPPWSGGCRGRARTARGPRPARCGEVERPAGLGAGDQGERLRGSGRRAGRRPGRRRGRGRRRRAATGGGRRGPAAARGAGRGRGPGSPAGSGRRRRTARTAPPRKPASWPGRNEPLLLIQSGSVDEVGQGPARSGRSLARTEPNGGKLSGPGRRDQPAVDRRVAAGQGVIGAGVVVADGVVDRADEGQVVGLPREHRQVLAELEARGRSWRSAGTRPGPPRGRRASCPRGPGAPGPPSRTKRISDFARPPSRLGPEQVRQATRPEQARPADAQDVATAQAVAEPSIPGGDPKHGAFTPPMTSKWLSLTWILPQRVPAVNRDATGPTGSPAGGRRSNTGGGSTERPEGKGRVMATVAGRRPERHAGGFVFDGVSWDDYEAMLRIIGEPPDPRDLRLGGGWRSCRRSGARQPRVPPRFDGRRPGRGAGHPVRAGRPGDVPPPRPGEGGRAGQVLLLRRERGAGRGQARVRPDRRPAPRPGDRGGRDLQLGRPACRSSPRWASPRSGGSTRGLEFLHLQPDATYQRGDRSRAFPALPVAEAARFLGEGARADKTAWIRSFRAYVRERMVPRAQGGAG